MDEFAQQAPRTFRESISSPLKGSTLRSPHPRHINARSHAAVTGFPCRVGLLPPGPGSNTGLSHEMFSKLAILDMNLMDGALLQKPSLNGGTPLPVPDRPVTPKLLYVLVDVGS